MRELLFIVCIILSGIVCFAHSTNNYNGKEIEEIFGKAQAKIELLVQYVIF